MTANSQANIVVVDDDEEIRSLLQDFLKKHGYQVYTAENSEALFALLKKHPTIDLILLDIMLPGVDGIEVCKTLRKTSQIPIIMLTAVNTDADRIISLELGADDYLAKPFNPRELVARVKAVLRRYNEPTHEVTNFKQQYPIFEFSGWLLDTATRRLVSADQVDVALGAAAYDLLLTFLEHPQHVLSRDQILEMTKNRTSDPFDRSIDVHISNLRNKLGDNQEGEPIVKTVRGFGYMFNA